MSLMIVISKFKNYFMKNTVLLLSILLGAIDCYFAQVKLPEWTKNATGKYSDLFSSKNKKWHSHKTGSLGLSCLLFIINFLISDSNKDRINPFVR